MRQIPSELVERYESEGWWTRETIGDMLARGLKAAPDTEFRIHSTIRPWSGTVSEVEHVARRLAAGLHRRGVGPGDVVAFQLPNWMEAAAVFWASSFLGATVVPIVHFYGPKELGYILRESAPKVFVCAEKFGYTEYRPELCADIPVVGVVGRDFDDLLDDEPFEGVLPVDPSQPALLAFTSGTTSDPKGVIHTHRTLGFETRQLSERYPDDRGSQLTGAPVGHFIGMVNAFLIPILDHTPINLLDAWDPARAIELMESDGLVIGGGATYFITSLLDHPNFDPDRHLQYMKYAGLGGSTVPAAVTRRLDDLGITVFRAYGSTEHPSITSSLVTDPVDKRLFTDGSACPGVEIRIADDGEILSRGPDLCMGYTNPELTARAFDEDGWYHTGDVAIVDEDGFLTITDRKADFIIRGGENISALEVEEVLLTLPAVAEAAVVSAPDERLGEHAAAVLRLRPGHEMPTLEDIRTHFGQAGIAKQKWPEELHYVDDFPRTASGKIQKFRVRQDIAAAHT
ncbi:AMP-binding protein [Rhodococcus pyridinivorans]|uniref:AMP-binding protein n=1 Tax=Rhodococcus pyridinivorans TaxID=103816 RepID=UPI0022834B72|nr:AMP-binding protein [Rhodococcus pyridinivorans]WAL45894.1 AMP-binding protein [Rhodococcus pyridinivorans]